MKHLVMGLVVGGEGAPLREHINKIAQWASKRERPCNKDYQTKSTVELERAREITSAWNTRGKKVLFVIAAIGARDFGPFQLWLGCSFFFSLLLLLIIVLTLLPILLILQVSLPFSIISVALVGFLLWFRCPCRFSAA